MSTDDASTFMALLRIRISPAVALSQAPLENSTDEPTDTLPALMSMLSRIMISLCWMLTACAPKIRRYEAENVTPVMVNLELVLPWKMHDVSTALFLISWSQLKTFLNDSTLRTWQSPYILPESHQPCVQWRRRSELMQSLIRRRSELMQSLSTRPGDCRQLPLPQTSTLKWESIAIVDVHHAYLVDINRYFDLWTPETKIRENNLPFII